MEEPKPTARLSYTFSYCNLIFREGCLSKEKISRVPVKVLDCMGWSFMKVFLFFVSVPNIIVDVEFLSLFHHSLVLLVDLLSDVVVQRDLDQWSRYCDIPVEGSP